MPSLALPTAQQPYVVPEKRDPDEDPPSDSKTLIPATRYGRDGKVKNSREIAEAVKDAVQKAQRDRDARFLQLWLRCVAFTKGVQHWQLSDAGKWEVSVRIPKRIIRLTENRVGPTVDQMIAMTTSEPPRFACPPATMDYEDVNRAEVGTALCRRVRDDYLKIVRDDPIVKYWCFTTGMTVVDTWFDTEAAPYIADVEQDPMTGEWVPKIDPVTGEAVQKPEGRLEKEIYTSFQTLFDENATGDHDAEWMALGTVMGADTIERRFGIKVPKGPESSGSTSKGASRRGISTSLSDTLRRAFSFVGPNASWFGNDLPYGTMAEPHGIEVWKMHIAPCPEYTSGRTIIVANDEIAYDDHCQTEGKFRFPCQVFYDMYDGKNPYGYSRVASLIPIQEELNNALSDLAMKRKINLNPRVMIPRECQVPKESFTSNPREVIEFTADGGYKPEYLPAPGIHPAEWQYVVDKREAFDFISGINDASRGVNPTGVRSGNQLEFLKGQNTQRLSTVTKRHRIAYGESCRYALFLLGRYWEEGKTVAAIGQDYKPFILEFKQAQFQEPFDIVVQNGITLPEDPTDRANMLTQVFRETGAMDTDTRNRYFELLNLGDVQRLIDEGNKQNLYTRAKYLRCLKGIPQHVDYYEDANTGRRVLRSLMLSEEFLTQQEPIKTLVVQLDTEYSQFTRGTVPMDAKGIPLPPGSYTPESLAATAVQGGGASAPQGSPPAPVMAPS